MEKKTRRQISFLWAFGMILAGFLLNHFRIGMNEFVGYATVGTYLMYIGILGLVIIAIMPVINRNKIRDERMEFVAAKSLRITFLLIILGAFAVMVLDGIRPIAIPYSMFLAYAIMAVMLAHFVIYRLMLRAN